MLFDQLPYLDHLENPAIVDVVKNNIVEILSLQKYLLATGLLKATIQDSLHMIVSSDGKLNDTAVRRQFDTKFPSAMRKPNPINVDFKDKAKFVTQNPIIATLSTQIEVGKLNEEKQIKNIIRNCSLYKGFGKCGATKRIERF